MGDFRDWKWQLQNRVITVEGLLPYLTPTAAEAQAISDTSEIFHFSVTPYYLSLIDRDNPDCPIRRQVIPLPEELAPDIVGAEDPLGEVAHSPVKNLIHNYPDRVAFCVTSECAIYCRYRSLADVDRGRHEDYAGIAGFNHRICSAAVCIGHTLW